jgi:wyosine [tRNA(Phe)-imidazoG37] synthetase (radical SAM superfamily)
MTFGPVPSRRLGQSLGVNLIPPKHCSFSCVYCQVGRTTRMSVARRTFYPPDEVVAAVRGRLAACDLAGVRVDYVSIVPDGEPTLEARLGNVIERLRRLGPPVAVITNGSLLDRADVRAELTLADWVSVKVDAGDEDTWRRVDRPHGRLRLAAVVEGLRLFAGGFRGMLVTETMLVEGVNDREPDLDRTAELLSGIAPAVAYLGVPIRPPAEPWVRPPQPATLVRAYAAMSRRLPKVELLTGEAAEAHAPSSDLERDLVATTAVHPLDEDAIVELGGGSRAALGVAADLVARGQLVVVSLRGKRFFLHPSARGRHRSTADA